MVRRKDYTPGEGDDERRRSLAAEGKRKSLVKSMTTKQNRTNIKTRSWEGQSSKQGEV